MAAGTRGSIASACSISSLHLLAGAERERPLERLQRALAIHQPQAQAPEALPRARRRAGPRIGGALGGLLGEVDRAHVFVDPRREAVRRRALPVDARPVAHRARGLLELARLPEGERHQPQHGDVARLGVARVDQPLRGQQVLAFGHRALGGDQEALDALLGGVGLGEVDEAHAAGGHRADRRG